MLRLKTFNFSAIVCIFRIHSKLRETLKLKAKQIFNLNLKIIQKSASLTASDVSIAVFKMIFHCYYPGVVSPWTLKTSQCGLVDRKIFSNQQPHSNAIIRVSLLINLLLVAELWRAWEGKSKKQYSILLEQKCRSISKLQSFLYRENFLRMPQNGK